MRKRCDPEPRTWHPAITAELAVSGLALLLACTGCTNSPPSSAPTSTTATPSASSTVVASSVPATATTSTTLGTTATTDNPDVLTNDEAVVVDFNPYCADAYPSHKCLVQGISTSDGSGGTLYAIVVPALTGDGAGRGGVYFFHGESLLTAAASLPPQGTATPDGPGHEWVDGSGPEIEGHPYGVSVPVPGEFAVRYVVSSQANMCNACIGNDGTDTYIYGWNGTQMALLSGTPPTPPAVIGAG